MATATARGTRDRKLLPGATTPPRFCPLSMPACACPPLPSAAENLPARPATHASPTLMALPAHKLTHGRLGCLLLSCTYSILPVLVLTTGLPACTAVHNDNMNIS